VKPLKQALIVLIANGLFVFLMVELNSTIAPLSLHITFAGLLIVYPAVKLPLRSGMPTAILSGALLDALLPGPDGLMLSVLGLLFCFAWFLRNRLRVQRSVHFAIVACGANLLVLAASALWFFPSDSLASYGSRFVIETVLSSMLVFTVALWFFDLQERIMDLLAARPTAEETA